ncbi:hypothetical protein EVAR_100860_1 [Eumeta japonica]|uniref:Uncharacterized protein n=1 Tax=Eumeta variegata TaxID=151549 RepID=A0A4C1SAW1_EUMVA|nr:hypothetical protein EVAR_100860_1 [Eumeta japonica]
MSNTPRAREGDRSLDVPAARNIGRRDATTVRHAGGSRGKRTESKWGGPRCSPSRRGRAARRERRARVQRDVHTALVRPKGIAWPRYSFISQTLNLPCITGAQSRLYVDFLNPLLMATKSLEMLGIPVEEWSNLLLHVVGNNADQPTSWTRKPSTPVRNNSPQAEYTVVTQAGSRCPPSVTTMGLVRGAGIIPARGGRGIPA